MMYSYPPPMFSFHRPSSLHCRLLAYHCAEKRVRTRRFHAWLKSSSCSKNKLMQQSERTKLQNVLHRFVLWYPCS